MKKIYAPWRDAYVSRSAKKPAEERMNKECAFCVNLRANNDEKYFVLKRFKHCFVMMNLYPYNGGHLMVLPLGHKGELHELSAEERAESIEVINQTIGILQDVMKPQGFNVGLNIGRAGGGGMPTHLHWHVLPRWEADTNFLPLLAETKPVSTDLPELYHQLKPKFDAL